MNSIGELTIGSDPDAVPRARRMTRAALADQAEDIADDAELVVSELVTNAALHGEPPITVRVRTEPCVRIEVEDAGRSVPILLQHNTETMTGRGLSMVAALASDWGVDRAPGGGKVVWAELGQSPSRVSQPEVDIEALLASWSDDEPQETVTVRLGDVSTELLLSAKAHIDNVVRELVLLREGEASSGVALAPEVAALIDTVTVDFADARAEIKRQAAGAAARGEALTDLELHLAPSAAEAGERYLEALDRADRYARSAHLLTLAPPRVHRLFREWYVRALIDQLRAHARGESPPPPRPFQVVLAEEVTRLSDEAVVSARLALLQKVTGELLDATTVEGMARIVVENAVHYLGVETAQVRILTEDGLLRSIARSGRRRRRDRRPDPDIAVDSDHPSAVVARTRRPLFLRSLPHARSPDPRSPDPRSPDPRSPDPESPGPAPAPSGVSDEYPPGRDGHAVPLAVGGRTVGVLSMSFFGGELTDEAQISFVEALGDALASAMRRAQLAASDAAQRETLSFLADATEILVSTRERDEVVARLVSLTVPRLGDWCTVYIAEDGLLRRVTMAIDGFPDLAGRLAGSALSLDEDLPHTRALRTGRVQYVNGRIGEMIERLYPGLDFSSIGGDPGGGAGLCVPLVLRDRRIGVVALTFLGSQRTLTPALVEALTGLATRAAIALDNAHRWDEQRRVVQSLVDAVLPDQPPVVPGVEFAVRYRPAAGEVAGDWWEAEPAGDGTILIGLGDAAGHGLPAVSRMSELRHGARALAVVEPSPAAVLGALNRRLSAPDSGFATAVYGRYHPASGDLVWASAGHVPPLHVGAGGPVIVLDDRPGAPLGSPLDDSATDRRIRLDPGDTLVLYSDGVVERRRDGVDPGVARLVALVAAHAGSPLATLADAIIEEACGRPADDCCLLLMRRTG